LYPQDAYQEGLFRNSSRRKNIRKLGYFAWGPKLCISLTPAYCSRQFSFCAWFSDRLRSQPPRRIKIRLQALRSRIYETLHGHLFHVPVFSPRQLRKRTITDKNIHKIKDKAKQIKYYNPLRFAKLPPKPV